MVINATFNNISVILWRKPEYPEKNPDLSQVTDKPLTSQCPMATNSKVYVDITSQQVRIFVENLQK
jgi:hypothetical protein